MAEDSTADTSLGQTGIVINAIQQAGPRMVYHLRVSQNLNRPWVRWAFDDAALRRTGAFQSLLQKADSRMS